MLETATAGLIASVRSRSSARTGRSLARGDSSARGCKGSSQALNRYLAWLSLIAWRFPDRANVYALTDVRREKNDAFVAQTGWAQPDLIRLKHTAVN